MKFLSFVQQGVEKSNRSLAAMAEVDNIFRMVNDDLKHFPGGELVLSRTLSTMGRVSMFTNDFSGVESDHLRHDKLTLSLKCEAGTFSEDVAGWKQRTTGYPCLLKFDGQELSCGTSVHLIDGISELLASVSFGNAVNRLEKRASATEKNKKPEAPLAAVKPAAKPLAKAAAKPAAKVAARGSSYLPAAVKAVPAKPVAKKSSSKRQDDSGEFSR